MRITIEVDGVRVVVDDGVERSAFRYSDELERAKALIRETIKESLKLKESE